MLRTWWVDVPRVMKKRKMKEEEEEDEEDQILRKRAMHPDSLRGE